MQGNVTRLDDEIDLRGLIRSLLKYKWWIVGITIGAALVTFLAGRLGDTGKTYDAKALVVIGQPPLNVNVNSPAASNVNLSVLALPDSKGITDLATVDDMLYTIYQSGDLAQSRAHGFTFAKFKQELTASISGTTQLSLQVGDPDPKQAALVVNLWAQAVTDRLNALYGSSSAMVTALEKQTNDAQQKWDAAEQGLLDYLPQSNLDALMAQLTQEQIAYNSQLGRIRSIDLLLSDGGALNGRLGARQPGAALTTGDALSLLALQQRANETLLCNSQSMPDVGSSTDANATGTNQLFVCSPSGGSSGLQIQVSGADLLAGQATVADAQQDLKSFMDALASQQSELKNGLTQTEKQLAGIRAQSEVCTISCGSTNPAARPGRNGLQDIVQSVKQRAGRGGCLWPSSEDRGPGHAAHQRFVSSVSSECNRGRSTGIHTLRRCHIPRRVVAQLRSLIKLSPQGCKSSQHLGDLLSLLATIPICMKNLWQWC